MRKLIALVAFVTVYASTIFAQIQFEIMHDSALDKFIVSLSSEKEMLSAPANRTSSAQITLKAKTGTFKPTNIKSLIPDVVWSMNSEYIAPEESPEFDYFSFTMESTGTDQIKYVKNSAVSVFEFTNKKDCGETIQIIDNVEDPFRMPNKSNANIGNYISVLGSQKLNSYTGTSSMTISQECAGNLNLTEAKPFEFVKDYFTLAPNLITTTGTLISKWDKEPLEAILTIRDINGQIVGNPQKVIAAMDNTYLVDLSNSSSGVYYIELSTASWQVIVDKAVKIEE